MKVAGSFLFILIAYLSFAGEAMAQYACLRAENPVEIEGSITDGDMLQVGRITRDGKPSTCLQDGSAVLENSTWRRRDTHTLVNPYNETVCVRVEQDFTGCAGNQTQSVAYSTFQPLTPANNVLGDGGYSTIGKGSYSFSVGPNASFSIGVNELEPSTGCPLYKLKVTYLRNCRQAGTDMTNDGMADPTVFRSTAQGGFWYTLDSETSQPIVRNFGLGNDFAVGGNDYTGDGRTDYSVYRQATKTWFYATDPDTPGTNFVGQPWGVAGDKVVPGDFDGDGKNDIAIFRQSEGRFYILRSSDGALQTHQWGSVGDIPVSGDFDGDTATDVAIVRHVGDNSHWWILKSNYRHGFHVAAHWGVRGDRYVPADYDGDGITDLAIFRNDPGVFYVFRSSNHQMEVFDWGTSGDVPQPADYDGDKKADYAIFRPSNGTWYIHNSGTGTGRVVNWGLAFDQPMTSPYFIQGAQLIVSE
jgi:hypothetical protein